MLKVKVLKKLPSPYVPKCDNNTLSIAKELFLAGKKETNRDMSIRAVLLEEINHTSSPERASDHLRGYQTSLYFPEDYTIRRFVSNPYCSGWKVRVSFFAAEDSEFINAAVALLIQDNRLYSYQRNESNI